MSHQLINDDWEMVAQLDVPLVHEDKLRQFSVYVSDVPPGNYRLMAILYNAQTGERVPWIDNPGYVPEMLNLARLCWTKSICHRNRRIYTPGLQHRLDTFSCSTTLTVAWSPIRPAYHVRLV